MKAIWIDKLDKALDSKFLDCIPTGTLTKREQIEEEFRNKSQPQKLQALNQRLQEFREYLKHNEKLWPEVMKRLIPSPHHDSQKRESAKETQKNETLGQHAKVSQHKNIFFY